jgi:YVTN family beta-propeller protein
LPDDLSHVQHPISALKIVAKVSIPGTPDWVGIDTAAVWISNRQMNNIARIDVTTNQVSATVEVGESPCAGVAIDFGSIWIPSCGDGMLTRIDSGSNAVREKIQVAPADSEGGLTAGHGAVWLPTDGGQTVARVDPGTDEISVRIPVTPGSFVAASDSGAVWVTSTTHNLVSRIDPLSRQVMTTVPVGPSPRFLTVGAGSVWILNQGDGTVSRVDVKTNQLIATIDVGTPGAGGDIAFGEGLVWTTAIDVPLTCIDPATNQVIKQFVGKGGDALRVGLGSVWICSFFLQEVWRVDPTS